MKFIRTHPNQFDGEICAKFEGKWRGKVQLPRGRRRGKKKRLKRIRKKKERKRIK